MAGDDLDVLGGKPNARELIDEGAARRIVANGRDNGRGGAKLPGMKREIGWRAAGLRAGGEQVPEKFTDANDDRPRVHAPLPGLPVVSLSTTLPGGT